MSKVVVLIVAMFLVVSCVGTPLTDSHKIQSVTKIYYHEGLIKNYMKISSLMRVDRLLKMGKTKTLSSNDLFKKVNSLINRGCHGGVASSHVFIVAKTNMGLVAFHQNKTASIGGKTCNISDEYIDKLIHLMELDVKFLR